MSVATWFGRVITRVLVTGVYPKEYYLNAVVPAKRSFSTSVLKSSSDLTGLSPTPEDIEKETRKELVKQVCPLSLLKRGLCKRDCYWDCRKRRQLEGHYTVIGRIFIWDLVLSPLSLGFQKTLRHQGSEKDSLGMMLGS